MMDPYQVLGVSRSASDEEIKKFARRRNPFGHPSVMLRKSKVLDKHLETTIDDSVYEKLEEIINQ